MPGCRCDEDVTSDPITPYDGPHTTTRRRVANDFSELRDAGDRHAVELGDDIAAPQTGGVRRSVAHDLFNQNATEPVRPLKSTGRTLTAARMSEPGLCRIMKSGPRVRPMFCEAAVATVTPSANTTTADHPFMWRFSTCSQSSASSSRMQGGTDLEGLALQTLESCSRE